MAIFMKSSLDVVLMDHIFLSQIWPVADHFYYYRWTHACANQYYLSWTELCAKSMLILRKFNSPAEGLVCIIENNKSIQTLGNSQDSWGDGKATETTRLQRATVELTLHCCACRLWEEWNKQEIDEVDEGQDIVPEQASCRDKDRKLTSSIMCLQLCLHYIMCRSK